MAIVSPKTFYISYGFAEGPQHGKRLRNALKKRGYDEVFNPMIADIIITHSGGSFLIPRGATPTLSLIIGTPIVPRKQLAITLLKKIWSDLHIHRRTNQLRFWFKKTTWNTFYMLRYFPDIVGMAVHAIRKSAVPSLTGQVIVIRNINDPFCPAEVVNHKSFEKYTHVELPGGHDDCWSNPMPYVDIVEEYYER